MNTPSDPIDKHLAALPRDITPPPSVWAGIAAAISPPRASRWPVALAASLVVAELAVTLMWSVMHPATAPLLAQGPAAMPPVTAVSFSSPNQGGYQRTRADIEQLFHERLALLRPDSRAKIEKNLQIIRDANEEIRRALEADPASPLLLEFLQSTDQQEFDLYRSVVRNTEPVMRST
jgi:hypothetical protein